MNLLLAMAWILMADIATFRMLQSLEMTVKEGHNEEKEIAGGLSFYIILLAVIIFMSFFMSRLTRPAEASLSEILSRINSGNVSQVKVTGYVVGIVERQSGNVPSRTFSKAISPTWMPRLREILEQAVADGKIDAYDYNEPTDISSWLNIVVILLMLGAMGAFIWFTYSRQAGDGRNAMSFGRSRAKLNDPTKNKVSFQDVAGADEEKEELQEVVDFLKNPKKYADLGARFHAASCLWVCREQVKHCWPKLSPAKPECRSFRSAVLILSRCLSVLARRVSATCLKPRKRTRRASFLSMKLMLSASSRCRPWRWP